MSIAEFVIYIVFVFPLISLVMGILGFYIFKNLYITPLIIFVLGVIASFTVYNTSFWFWAILYTFISFLSGLIIKVFSSKRT